MTEVLSVLPEFIEGRCHDCAGRDVSLIHPMAQVRDRAGAATRACTLEALLDERMLELALEGWRRQDLIRFGKYHLAYDLRPQLPSEADAHTTVFPIPHKCIELNRKLKQNKGYE